MTRKFLQEELQDNELEIDFQENLESSQVLCFHCKRTMSNGISCKGMCVADNDY